MGVGGVWATSCREFSGLRDDGQIPRSQKIREPSAGIDCTEENQEAPTFMPRAHTQHYWCRGHELLGLVRHRV